MEEKLIKAKRLFVHMMQKIRVFNEAFKKQFRKIEDLNNEVGSGHAIEQIIHPFGESVYDESVFSIRNVPEVNASGIDKNDQKN